MIKDTHVSITSAVYKLIKNSIMYLINNHLWFNSSISINEPIYNSVVMSVEQSIEQQLQEDLANGIY